MPDTIVIEELSLAAVDVNSVPFDFADGFGDTWEEVSVGLLRCGECSTHFVDDPLEEGDPCAFTGCDTGTLERPECAPMMNYYYALPYYEGDPEADQLTLYQSSANVVLIRMMGIDHDEDAYYLALSGGGMDLSWDICHAYILLGYAPPLQFCNLPDFAGQDNKREPFWTILKACLRSAKAVEQRALFQTGQLMQRVNAALACCECGHPDPHNRVGGCEKVDVDFSSGHGEAKRCPCLHYCDPEDRPTDAEAVRMSA